MKRYFDTHFPGGEYNGAERRKQAGIKESDVIGAGSGESFSQQQQQTQAAKEQAPAKKVQSKVVAPAQKKGLKLFCFCCFVQEKGKTKNNIYFIICSILVSHFAKLAEAKPAEVKSTEAKPKANVANSSEKKESTQQQNAQVAELVFFLSFFLFICSPI
jgi:hypothetical protein